MSSCFMGLSSSTSEQLERKLRAGMRSRNGSTDMLRGSLRIAFVREPTIEQIARPERAEGRTCEVGQTWK